MRSLRTPLLVASLLALPIGAAHAQTPPPGAASPPAATPPTATAPTAAAPAPADVKAADPAPAESAAPATTAAAAPTGLPPLAKDDAVAGGIGIASLVVGLALVGVAGGMQSSLASSAPKDEVGNPVCGKKPGTDAISPSDIGKCDSLRGQAALGNTLGNLGVGMAISGGLLVGAAAAYWLFSAPKVAPGPRAAALPTLRIAPAVSSGFGGLVVVGSF